MPIAAYIKFWLCCAVANVGLVSLSFRLMRWQWTWFGESQVEDGEFTYSYWNGEEHVSESEG